MLSLLWGSPLPPVRSGVSDYAVELLPELARHATVRVLAPPGWRQPPDWPLEGRVEVVAGDTPRRRDEIEVLHLGNNPYHEWLIDRLPPARGVVVLHDPVLHHLLIESTVARGDVAGYQHRVSEAHGLAGAALARGRLFGLGGRRDPFLFPARRAFLSGVRTVIVHSEWAAREVVRDLPHAKVVRLGLAVADPGEVDRDAARRVLGLSGDRVVLMHLGFLTPAKGLRHVLEALAAARRLGAPVELVLVGEGTTSSAVTEAVRSAGLEGAVHTTGWVDQAAVRILPAAADLGVVLRTPSAGETSAAAVRFLACGTPVAVAGLRQFLEWPEPAAPRLTPGPAASAELARMLVAAAGPGWGARRAAARAAYEARHLPGAAAAAMVAALAAA